MVRLFTIIYDNQVLNKTPSIWNFSYDEEYKFHCMLLNAFIFLKLGIGILAEYWIFGAHMNRVSNILPPE